MTNLPNLRLYRLATGWALILAPLLFLVDNLLHPEELTRGHQLEQVGLIADSYDRWQAAHAIGFVAILAFAPAVLGLAFLVRRRQPTLGLVGGALAIAGLLGLAAAITIDGFAWGVVGELSANPEVGPDGAAAALKELQESGWSYVYYLAPLGFIVGMVILAAGAARQGAASTWAAALLALAVLMAGTETAIVSNAYFIAGASVLLAGGVAVALPILRMSDEQFAQGSA
jgi:hypothetical protein